MSKKEEEVKTAPGEAAGKGEEVDLLGGDRESLYERYAEAQEKEKGKEEKKEESLKSSPAPEEKPHPEDYQPAPPAVPEASKAKDEPSENFKKTVPYDALHAEREKRRAAQARLRDLESEIQSLKQATETQKKISESPIEDYETEIKGLKQMVLELQGQLQSQQSRATAREREEMIKSLQTRIAQTASELQAEGFPLFDTLQHRVAAEIGQLVEAADPEEREVVLREWDSPQGWKRIYRERVFPGIQSAFSVHLKSEESEAKKEMKKQAQLTGSPGVKPEEKKEEKEWTVQDYFAERRKSNISGLKS